PLSKRHEIVGRILLLPCKKEKMPLKVLCCQRLISQRFQQGENDFAAVEHGWEMAGSRPSSRHAYVTIEITYRAQMQSRCADKQFQCAVTKCLTLDLRFEIAGVELQGALSADHLLCKRLLNEGTEPSRALGS